MKLPVQLSVKTDENLCLRLVKFDSHFIGLFLRSMVCKLIQSVFDRSPLGCVIEFARMFSRTALFIWFFVKYGICWRLLCWHKIISPRHLHNLGLPQYIAKLIFTNKRNIMLCFEAIILFKMWINLKCRLYNCMCHN